MTQDSPSPDQSRLEQAREQEQLLSSSAVMAAGTIVSRFSGYLRSLLLAAALGNLLHADQFTIGNTIPNMLYILLAGGIFNAVLVPQLVRSMRSDPDRGEAYTNRIVTLSALFLGAVTVDDVLDHILPEDWREDRHEDHPHTHPSVSPTEVTRG